MICRRCFHPGLRSILMGILFLAFFYDRGYAQDVQVGSKLDKYSMPIGAQTVLHISAHMPSKTEITFPELKDSIGKIKIVKSLKPDTAFDKNDPAKETITHHYVITSFDTGMYTIPGLPFRTKTALIPTNTVSLQIKPVLVDTTKTFYDIKQPFVVSYTFWDWLKDHWVWVLGGLILILAVTGIIYYLKNRPEPMVVEKAAPVLSADRIALDRLNQLRDKKLWQQNEIKLYYSELTEILREYLERRYHIKALEQTTEEIFAELKTEAMPANAEKNLKQLLTLADLVKFAREKPSAAQNEQSMDTAIDFIKETMYGIQPAGHKEELPE